MPIDLTDTTTGAIYEALTDARSRLGGAALGMVLTLVVETDEAAAKADPVRPCCCECTGRWASTRTPSSRHCSCRTCPW